MKIILRLLCTVVGSVLVLATAAVPALAQSTDSTQLQRTDFLRTLTVDQFDPALGELVGVELSALGDITSEVITLTNIADSTADFEAFDNVEFCFDWSGTVSGHLSCLATGTHIELTTSATEQFLQVPSGETVSSAVAIAASDSASQSLTGAAVAPFVGTGAVSFDVSTSTSFGSSGGGGNAIVEIVTFASGSIQVAYQYANIDIEKLTNGVDADVDPVVLAPGDAVTWTYNVTNTGNVGLTGVAVVDDVEGEICVIASLAAGATDSCTHSGTATEGSYSNTATATGQPDGFPDAAPVTADDPSNYIAAAPTPVPTATPDPTATPVPPIATPVPTQPPPPDYENPVIDIELDTDGVQADDPNGPSYESGDPITWTYVVTNPGNVDLYNVVVTDSITGRICARDFLAIAHSFSCTLDGTAGTECPHFRVGVVRGVSDSGVTVRDTDPTHHCVGDEVLGVVETPAPPAAAPVPTDQVLALTGESGNTAAAIALVAAGLGLVLFSVSETLRRRER